MIQDRKRIGAVTHVLVNDPTTGYGIFIENMLDAAGYIKCQRRKASGVFCGMCYNEFVKSETIKRYKHEKKR